MCTRPCICISMTKLILWDESFSFEQKSGLVNVVGVRVLLAGTNIRAWLIASYVLLDIKCFVCMCCYNNQYISYIEYISVFLELEILYVLGLTLHQ